MPVLERLYELFISRRGRCAPIGVQVDPVLGLKDGARRMHRVTHTGNVARAVERQVFVQARLVETVDGRKARVRLCLPIAEAQEREEDGESKLLLHRVTPLVGHVPYRLDRQSFRQQDVYPIVRPQHVSARGAEVSH